jgi:aminoglycoside phosphotransferase (APT) family kinase protein
MWSQHRPGGPVKPLGEGLDNVVYETGDGLIMRCPKQPDPEALQREVRILAAVAAVSPIPVPQPVGDSRVCLVYPKLQGVPLIAARPSKLDTIVARLRAFLEIVHGLEVDAAEPDEVPLEEWLAEAAQTHQALAPHIPAAHREPIASFLNSPPPPDPGEIAFCHNDFDIEHILVDGETVTGVIDWTDAALTDPARDHAKLYRDLGPIALPPSHLRDRAVFYARCGALEDLAYGLSTGQDAYTGKSLDSLRWLFPDRISL